MKLLIKKPKKEFIKELNREVTLSKARTYLVEDEKKDFHCSEGVIAKKDLAKKKGKVKTNKNAEFSILEPCFIDIYRRIKRSAQIIPLKDIGSIVALTGVNPKSMVVDAGAGSGGLCCFLANIAKEVVTYEIRDDFYEIVKGNIKFLGLKNLKIKKQDVCKKIDEKNVDLICFDLPSPWGALKNADKSLKIGGFLVSYSPTIPQVMDFMTELKKYENLICLRTIEIIERDWEINERKVRPRSQQIGHSGFLTFVRKIG